MNELQLQQVQRLRPAVDIEDKWRAFKDPINFDYAYDIVRQVHLEDGVVDDIPSSGLHSWAFGTPDGTHMAISRVPYPGRPAGEPYILRSHAFNQLCSKATVGSENEPTPARYIKALPAKLQVACMNYSMLNAKNDYTLRTVGNEVRAIMSGKYAAIDDIDYLNEVGECLDILNLKDIVKVRSLATGPHMIMRLTVPSEGKALKVNDVIEWGLDIGNSELGLRSVQITPITYRLVCTNGMRNWRSEGITRFRHIGDAGRIKEELRDAIPVAIAEANGDVKKWEKSVDILIDNALDEINGLRGFGLSKNDVAAVSKQLVSDIRGETEGQTITELLNDFPVTAFEVANAITATGRERATVARLNFEEVGHRYLTKVAA